jgi:hypothetical protein
VLVLAVVLVGLVLGGALVASRGDGGVTAEVVEVAEGPPVAEGPSQPAAAAASSRERDPAQRAPGSGEHVRSRGAAPPAESLSPHTAPGRPTTGAAAIPLVHGGGSAAVQLTHSGSGAYRFAVTDADGRPVTVLAEGTGPLETTVAMTLPPGPVRIEGWTDGTWSAELAPATLQPLPAVLQGRGTAVGGSVRLRNGSVRLEVDAPGRPQVVLLDTEGPGRHVAELIPGVGYVAAVPGGTYLVEVTADGPWQATVSQGQGQGRDR